MKRVLTILLAAVALIGAAQENQELNLHFDQSKISPQFTQPELQGKIMPATNIKPTFKADIPSLSQLKLDYRTSRLNDSLSIYNEDWRNNSTLASQPRFTYDTNPYANDWNAQGVITRVGNAYLVGSGAHTTYPGLGNTQTASVALMVPLGDRFQVTGGVMGSKYHFDRSAWNDYGVFGNASFRINDKLSLNAFGQYYAHQQFHSVASMSLIGSSSYGGTLGWKASDHFSLDVGARRIYDPYTGQWRTMPIVQPTINVFGAPISLDAGPLIYQILGNLFNHGQKRYDWGHQDFEPGKVPDAIMKQPGFNPNSPVPVPDAFRH